jgi:hypothetical protein
MNVRQLFCGLFTALFPLLCLLPPPVALAVDDEVTRASLRGLDGVRVVMEDLRPEIIKEGLREDQVRFEVEQQLRSSGIKVLADERLPFLMICPYITKFGKDSYSYFVRMDFYQLVVPYQSLSQETDKESSPPIESALFAATWTSPGVIGTTRTLTDVKRRIGDEVAKFIAAFKAANPQ